MKKQIQCPECLKFKVAKVSARYVLMGFGAASVFLGLFLAIFIIGIPFLVLGVILLIVGACVPDSGKRRCQECGKIFYQ